MSCELPGCDKLKTGSVACSEHHLFLLMDFRYSSCRSKPPLFRQKPPHFCAFLPCHHPPSHGHSCCSKRHYLSWLQCSYARLQPDQICQLPGCFRHVFVHDGSSRIEDFCGWKHCQQFHSRHALHSSGQKFGMGHEPSVESLMQALKDFVVDKSSPPRNVEVHEDFFTKHPWDVLNRQDAESCWLIARRIWKQKDSSKRELITMGNYHWKQQGKPSSHSNEISKRYLTYTELGKKKRESNGMSYTMLEYAFVGAEDFKDYCLVKLSRGRVSQNQARKRPKSAHEDRLEDVDSNNKQPSIGNVLQDGNNELTSIKNTAEEELDSNHVQQSSVGIWLPDAGDSNYDFGLEIPEGDFFHALGDLELDDSINWEDYAY